MNSQEWNPGELLKTSGDYWRSCTVHAGVKLDVFSAIGNKELSSEDVAQKVNADKRAVAVLLNALTAMGLLAKTDDKYRNTPFGGSFLSKDSEKYIGYMVMHHHHLVESWSKMDEAVRTGKPVRTESSHSSEERRESFLMGMFNTAMNVAPFLVPKIDLSDRHHLLDLGGGPGTYAIHFCLNNPKLRATVYDLPTTRPFAEKTIERFDLSGRISFMDGDYLEQGVEGVYDVAWISHILHAEGPEECQRIIEKTVSVLEPGGMIMIHDFILNNTMDSPPFPALFSLNMLLGTPDGQSYSEQQIMGMLIQAGAKDIKRLPLKAPNDSGVITGVV